MKTFAIAALAAALFVLTPAAFAADEPAATPAVKTAKHHARAGMMQKLNLTDDQKAKVKEILKDAHAKAKQAADKTEKKAIMKAAHEKIKTDVLTADQVKQLESMKGKHTAKKKSQ